MLLFHANSTSAFSLSFQAKVLYDFVSEGEGELSVYTNEVLTVTKKVSPQCFSP